VPACYDAGPSLASPRSPCPGSIRNIAIIAHVDPARPHWVDQMPGVNPAPSPPTSRSPNASMDSNDLERTRHHHPCQELARSITRARTSTSFDTPAPRRLGGEVERVLSLVDGCLLLVDAVEGPMPQTRFRHAQGLALGLKPIVVINKIDRPGARPDWVINHTFDLFDKLGASEEQIGLPGSLLPRRSTATRCSTPTTGGKTCARCSRRSSSMSRSPCRCRWTRFRNCRSCFSHRTIRLTRRIGIVCRLYTMASIQVRFRKVAVMYGASVEQGRLFLFQSQFQYLGRSSSVCSRR